MAPTPKHLNGTNQISTQNHHHHTMNTKLSHEDPAPYKDKYFAMLKRYETGTSDRESALQDITQAEVKLASIQAECDALIDALASRLSCSGTNSPQQSVTPNLIQYMRITPEPDENDHS